MKEEATAHISLPNGKRSNDIHSIYIAEDNAITLMYVVNYSNHINNGSTIALSLLDNLCKTI